MNQKPTDDGRRGKVFAVRLADETRQQLELKERQSRDARGYTVERRYRSLGGFLVWAALQWQPKQLRLIPDELLPVQRRTVAKPKKHKRRRAKVVPSRRRRGNTKGKKKGGRR